MENKYGGDIDKETLISYFNRLIPRIHKLLYEKEEGCKTVEINLKNLMIEISGGNELIYKDKIFIELLNNLEVLTIIEERLFKSQIFKCMSICKKIVSDLSNIK